MMNGFGGRLGQEDFEKIIEIVTDARWEVPLHDPVQSFSEEIEDIGC
jgi:hypothetical protein